MKKLMSAVEEWELREKLKKTEENLRIQQNLAVALMNKPWINLTAAEATELWERIDDRDSWELIMQVQIKLKEKNCG